MQPVGTIERDPAGSNAPLRRWTLRSAVRESTPLARAGGTTAVGAALVSSASVDVPVAAALPVAVLVFAALVDVIERRLPDTIVITAALVGVAAAVGTELTGGDLDPRHAALGALAFAGPLLAMHLISPSSMGFGDVKVAAVLGAALGLIDPLFALGALTAGCLVGAAAGLVTRARTIALGPALVAGAIAALCLAASPFEVLPVPTAPSTEGVES